MLVCTQQQLQVSLCPGHSTAASCVQHGTSCSGPNDVYLGALLTPSPLRPDQQQQQAVMENIIDIQLVKEQLRLLGHNVADEVILEFVKGLNTGTGE